MKSKNLLIGIDVGGTNTDSVLINPAEFENSNRGILAYHKSTTTSNISEGIVNAVNQLFEKSSVAQRDDVLAVMIGTTHFINAVVEQDKARLDPVAVLRLCGPYSKGSRPFSDFPKGLTKLIESYTAYVNGGFRVDGNEIQPLDEIAVREHAEKIKKAGIKSVAIVGMFSTLDNSHETRAAAIVKDVIPDANVVVSSNVSGIGFLKRENASILNASIMSFATKTIHSLYESIKKSGCKCPLFLTQNDGTVLTVEEALEVPIRTFSSGATNSMRGAAFLCAKEEETTGRNVMVVDIGGTTTDVGLLLSNGFPRQAGSHSVVGGVSMNFSMPHTESIGLGGGSIVRESGKEITVGPDSVGSEILKRSKVFGGESTTATDVTVSDNIGSSDESFKIGDLSLVEGKYSKEYRNAFKIAVKKKLESVIDRMRTNADPLPVLLVGGGSFIAPDELDGANIVIRPPYFQVANAIGAAMGKLSASMQRIVSLASLDEKESVIKQMTDEITDEMVQKGSLRESITITELSYDPVPYVERTFSFKIKVVGDIDYDNLSDSLDVFSNENIMKTLTSQDDEGSSNAKKNSAFEKSDGKGEDEEINFETYKPLITDKREWVISEVDLEFFRIGTYILGCGGGGTPFPAYLEARNMLRDGETIRVIDPKDCEKYATKDGSFISVGFAGSPTVADEQLQGIELVDAAEALFDYSKETADAVFPLEIGGGNGFEGLLCGSSSKLNLPVVDTDLMGRAYPTHSQISTTVCSEDFILKLTSVSDGNGNKFIITDAQSEIYVERMLRAALSEIGCHVGVINNPLTSDQLKDMTIHNSLSLAWRIGRAVRVARQKHDIDNLPDLILGSIGGPRTGRKIFEGKIVGVEKRLFKGHVYGEVEILNEKNDRMIIPFKNENILAKVKKDKDTNWEVAASVPDLISVCFNDSGEAVGTPDYRYGVMVFVLAFAPNRLWTSSEKGITVGGPKSFGPAFKDVVYKPVGEYVEPLSVIDEYDPN